MSTLQITLLVTCFCLLSANVFADTNYTTTVKLPTDKQIWPLPKLDLTENIVSLEAKFIESKEILAVTQGNWKKVTYLVRYEVIRGDKKYPYKDIVFIAEDTWPSEGSHIMVKKLAWPFTKGNKSFYLRKDDQCKHTDYFEIITYSR